MKSQRKNLFHVIELVDCRSSSPVLGGVDYFLGDQNKPEPEI
uniref:Uncharacterized protein n=1 Tax=Musa acuminata subsp. malaccensis TaxID=214687 RepID=A0A804JK64_MUSAM